jgi:hypothetical protein
VRVPRPCRRNPNTPRTVHRPEPRLTPVLSRHTEGSGEVADDYEGFALPRPVSAFDERGTRPV